MRNIHVKLYKIRTRGSGGDVVKINTDRWTTDDGQRPITIAHLDPQVSLNN